jgi:hypothetical protein
MMGMVGGSKKTSGGKKEEADESHEEGQDDNDEGDLKRRPAQIRKFVLNMYIVHIRAEWRSLKMMRALY